MEGDRHPAAVRMLIALVATLLPPEEKAVQPEGAYDLPRGHRSEAAVPDAMSDGDRNPRVRQHLDVFARAFR